MSKRSRSGGKARRILKTAGATGLALAGAIAANVNVVYAVEIEESAAEEYNNVRN